ITRSGVKEDHTASYFSHNNAEGTRLREQLAADSLEMLIQWLRDGGNVGIHGGSRINPYYPHDIYLTPPVRCNQQHKGAEVYAPHVSCLVPLTVLLTGLILNNGL